MGEAERIIKTTTIIMIILIVIIKGIAAFTQGLLFKVLIGLHRALRSVQGLQSLPIGLWTRF